MKTFALVVLSVILSATASPLGDRAVFRRHKGTPLSRRFILESRQNAPAACAALPSATTSSPDVSSTDVPPVDPTTTGDNSTDTTDPGLASNTTIDPTATDNSTVADNSTTTTNSTATRRFWARHGFSGFGFSDGFSEHSSVSVSVSFEESVTTFVQTWEDLCLVSGGDIFTHDPCVNLGGSFGIDALLETADPCDQQDLADSMITFAKSRGIKNRDDLIDYAIRFRKHARRSVEILGVLPSSLFCLKASINPELNGIYNEQIDGANPGLFGSPNDALVPFGSSGTCPYEMTADVDSCGCIGSDGSDSSDSTDGTDDSTDGTDDSSDSTDGTDDSSDSTDSSDSSDSTSTDSSDASATDSADASAATDASSTASTADATVTPPPDATGPNFQPTDISGNVNDPAGRR